MSNQDLSLKDLIQAVSEELRASRDERLADGLGPLFEIQDLTIEVSFVVTKSKGVRGGFDLKVISAGGDVKYDNQEVQKVTLKLRALGQADLEIPDVPDHLPLRPRTDD
jgi:hypothetical protein